MEIQELISRGRFLFSGAQKRFHIFKMVNGKLSSKDIARKANRSLSSVLQDIEKIRNFDLIVEKQSSRGEIIKKEGSVIYEKAPLVKHIPLNYFNEVADTKKIIRIKRERSSRKNKDCSIKTPNEQKILSICKDGESQIYEFKAPGTGSDKIAKEVAGFAHTRNGGIIFYGIEDDGTIIGSDITRQIADQKFHNSIRSSISPQPKIEVKSVNVMGSAVVLILISPWDKKTIYQCTTTEKYYIRKGTNIFAIKSDELKKLNRGEFVS